MLVSPSILFHGYDRKTCRVAPSVAVWDGGREALLFATRLRIESCDGVDGDCAARSSDGGRSWTPLAPIPEISNAVADDTFTAFGNGIAGWHAASRRVLVTGKVIPYRRNAAYFAPDYEAMRASTGGAGILPAQPRGVGILPAKQSQAACLRPQTISPSHAWYAVYDPATNRWNPPRRLVLPSEYAACGPGMTQRLYLSDGTILLPMYGHTPSSGETGTASFVARCDFDGETLRVLDIGPELLCPIPRGFGEPSIVRHGGRFLLTLRNDESGQVAVSDDGLHFGAPANWTWRETGERIGNANTQQHFASVGGRLWLVYTRVTPTNGHVFRNRAPLFAAEVDFDRGPSPALLRETEIVVVPERGARLGNFAVTQVSDNEAWVTVGEWMQSPRFPGLEGCLDCESHGSDNAIWLSRLTLP